MANDDNQPMSFYTKMALGALVISFIIILVLLIYYWWSFRYNKLTDIAAQKIAIANPALAQKILDMRLRCIGNIPNVSKLKTPAPGGAPPPPPTS